MKINLTKFFVSILGFLISIIIIALIIEKFDLKSTFNIIKTVNIYYIILMLIIYLSTFIFRAIRWKLMLSNFFEIKFSFLLKSIIFGFAGNNLLPARGGEILRMELFSRKTKINRITIITSIVLEKIIDSIILLLLLVISSLFLSTDNYYFTKIIKIISSIFIPLLISIFYLRAQGHKITMFLNKKEGYFFNKINFYFENFIKAFQFLKFDFNTFIILSISLLIWCLESIVFIIGLSSFGLNDSLLIIGIVTMCILNFGILIPSSPGYIGLFQAVIILVLSNFNIPQNQSLAIAIVIHACQFLPITLIGFILFFKTYAFNSELQK